MRLIDADELRKKFYGFTESGIDVALDHYAVSCVDNAPTVDAVQVVRCRDCRFHEQEQPGMVYCPATVGGWVEENWFCKGGERRSE